jgi:hypothetical protein
MSLTEESLVAYKFIGKIVNSFFFLLMSELIPKVFLVVN